ncbi:MAG: ABC transporter permease [Gemmatimonadetes bacterium]|nr:ABC transporter permease [Gemmatimonadota bacterium]
MSILRMAWRNVWRNRRRSLVTVAATTLAFTVMVLYSSLVQGYLVAMERNLLDLELGDVQVHDPRYQDDPSLYSSIADASELLARFDAKGYAASARLLGFGLGAGADASAGVQIQGIDVVRDRRVSRIYERVKQGRWLDPGAPHEVVVGSQLARTLVVKPGDELILLSQAADGSTANDIYTVRGVLQGVSEAVDRVGVFMTDAAFRRFFAFPEGAHEIILRRPPDMDVDAFAASVRELAPNERVQTWRELAPTLASLLDSARSIMVVVFLIVYVAIGILILNAMLMAVFERIREFGVLKAIGYAPGQVLLVILGECAMQTLLAIVAGLLLAWPGLWYLTRVGIDMGKLGGMAMMGVVLDPIWRGVVNPSVFTMPLVTLVAIVGLAAAYPAARAAWISPIRAIQHR